MHQNTPFHLRSPPARRRPVLGTGTRKLASSFLALCLGVVSLVSISYSPRALALDLQQIARRLPAQGEIHLLMFNADQPDGFMRLGWSKSADNFELFDRTMLPSAEVYETYSASLSPDNLHPKRVDIALHVGVRTHQIRLRIGAEQGELRRRALAPGVATRQSTEMVPVTEGTVLRALSFLIPLVDRSSPGETLEYTWLEPLSPQPLAKVSLRVMEGGNQETPAGEVDTLKYELRGAEPANDIFVSKREPRQIVRIDVLGSALNFRLPPAPTPAAQ